MPLTAEELTSLAGEVGDARIAADATAAAYAPLDAECGRLQQLADDARRLYLKESETLIPLLEADALGRCSEEPLVSLLRETLQRSNDAKARHEQAEAELRIAVEAATPLFEASRTAHEKWRQLAQRFFAAMEERKRGP